MAKISGNEFNNSKFFNAKFIGNVGQNSVYQDVNNASKQSKGSVEDTNKQTLGQFEDLFEELQGLHGDYLDKILEAEKKHYERLTKTDSTGLIYSQYDRLYKKLEARHAEYLQKIGGGTGNTTNVAGWINGDIKSENVSVAGTSESGSGNSPNGLSDATFALKSDLRTINSNVNTAVNNTYAIGKFLYDTNKDNKENKRYADKLRDSIEKGTKVQEQTAKDTRDTEGNTSRFKVEMREVNRKVDSIVNDVGSYLIQGKHTKRVFDDILDVIEVFQQQESVADSVVSLIMIGVKQLLRWIGDGVSDQYQTQDETFKSFGLYLARAESLGEQSALYSQLMVDKVGVLEKYGLRNNIAVTEWYKLQIGLLEKGFSTEESYSASFQNVLLNKIAPALDTNNQNFLDLQQNGMFNLTKSLGGIVESVRDTAGSSRITMGSMSAILDKLVPVELYTKRELLGNKARMALSALEHNGMSTADAINLVSDSIEAYYDPYKGLTSGNVLQRVALAQMGGNPSDPWELIGAQLGLANMFTSGTNSALTQGAVNSYLGAGWLNARADYSELFQNYMRGYEEASEIEETPANAYDDLIRALADKDLFTTAEQQADILAKNNTQAIYINGWLQDLALDVAKIVGYFQLLLEDKDIDYYTEDANATLNNLLTQVQNGQITEEEYKKEIAKWKEKEQAGQEAYYRDAKTKTELASLETGVLAHWGSALIGLPTPLAGVGGYLGMKAYGSGKFNNFVSDDSTIGKVFNTLSSVSDKLPIKLFGTGGYVKNPQLAVVGDNPYGEIISPIPQLSQAVMRGVSLSNKNNKPDTSSVEAVIVQATEAIVKAIAENGGITLDTETGLMSGSIKTNLQSIMGNGSH